MWKAQVTEPTLKKSCRDVSSSIVEERIQDSDKGGDRRLGEGNLLMRGRVVVGGEAARPSKLWGERQARSRARGLGRNEYLTGCLARKGVGQHAPGYLV